MDELVCCDYFLLRKFTKDEIDALDRPVITPEQYWADLNERMPD